jgi:predicted amidohydrolase YtcJ
LEQFGDDPSPFHLAELDAVAPNNPLLLQASYYEAFLNSYALQLLAVDKMANVPGIERDETGRPTGHVTEQGLRALVDHLPLASGQELETSSRGMIAQLNRMGLTAFGAVGCDEDLLSRYRRWADQRELNVRIFCIVSPPGANTPEELISRIPQIRLFDGDSYINHIAFGENPLAGLNDPMFQHRSTTKAEDVAELRRILTEVAASHLTLHVHVNFAETIGTYLDVIEAVNKEHPIRNLRWEFAHLNQPTAEEIERMKHLGIYAAVHPWGVINGGINVRQFGQTAYSMAPLAMIQKSGITWGLGSDGSRANQMNPFEALSWAVTGKMVGGKTVLNQTISREDALIAYTRKNAYFVFQEDNLGSIQAGKLADFVVIDRDYLTVPQEEIKRIKSVMTVVGGRVVFDDTLENTAVTRKHG